jgi:hypothetical protein
MLFLEPDQARTDAVLNKVLGWIVAKYSSEHDVSMSQAFKNVFSSKFYEELTDYSNDLYLSDPLELYRMLMAELSRYHRKP